MKAFFRKLKSWATRHPIWSASIVLSTIITFSITVQVFMQPPVSLEFWQQKAHYVYNYFTNWASVLTASVTLLLAFAAFWTIWQNYWLKERDHRERRLNEVIEWAADILNCGRDKLDWEMALQLKDPHIIFKAMAIKLNMSYTALRETGRRIAALSTGLDKDLGTIVNDTQIKLGDIIKATYQESKEGVLPESLKTLRNELDKTAIQVLEKATNLQLKLLTP